MIQFDLNQKRIPRLLLIQHKQPLEALKNMSLIWPDKSESSIYDLSFAGINIAATTVVSKLKLGEYCEPKLKVLGFKEPLKLKMKVATVSARSVGLSFDATTVEGKLTLEQGLKDLLILENLNPVEFDANPMLPDLQKWYHAPFETNILFFDESSPYSMAVEYDHVIAFYGAGEWTLRKSLASTETQKSYFGPFIQAVPGNISLGASWLDRLVRLLDLHPLARTDLALLIERLRKHKTQ